MSWNEPSDHGDGRGRDDHDKRDPWQRERRPDNGNGSDNGFAFISDFWKKLSGGNGGSPFDRKRTSPVTGICLILGVAVLGIAATGFYTVREAERAVVLSLGKFDRVEEPGLHWYCPFLQSYKTVDIQMVRSTRSKGSMLTQDENVVNVEMEVQYRVDNPVNYLYRVVNPDDSLNQATDSALRYVIGHTSMDDVLTNGRERVRQSTRELLGNIISPYNMGITVVDVNFLPARAPDEVKAAFDDAIAAQEDEQRFKREAVAYKNEVLPKAEGKVRRIVEEAEGYQREVVAKAHGDVARFEKILPEYLKSPEITKRRIYLETMEEVYAKNPKVIINTGSKGAQQLMYLPLDQLMKQGGRE
ncbi:FtsH protease activity modulator HflK [Succinimonas amylolytica]|uniref:FtsH protease activity modulator HflK n=1 Tax=Succinimonas amylolytica TaxID=83769 RepID=UPI00036E0FB6|nr:FtsH protease activity modulator HflK [Succinimonas amylolytica]